MKERPKTLPIETSLDQIPLGQGGWVSRLEGPEGTVRRLMEMGLVEEAFVEMVHEAPFGGDPVAVRVRGSLLALRRADAKNITVRRVQSL